MADVAATELTKRFGDVVAVDGVELSIERGEFFSLLGPSGCGKSTTLRLVAGLEAPTRGRILIGGRDVTRLPSHRRDIGMVFQSYALFPHLSVAANVAYGLRSRRVPAAERQRRVGEALERVGLGALGERRVHQLSGGQQQRVAVARAIVLRPALLLLDEPLSNLDAKLRVQTRAMLRQVQQELGITTLYVTHDQEEALTLSDRLAVMRDGRIEQVAPPREAYDRPTSAFVAAFLGRANLVPARVVARGERWRVDVESYGPLDLAPPAAELGEQALLCVRPQAVRLAPGGRARVRDVVFNGAGIDYEVELAGRRWSAVEPNVGQPLAAPGEAVSLTLDPGGATLLPPEDP